MNENQKEEKNRRKGMILSAVLHTILLAILAIFGMSYMDPPPEPGGITVNLGIPDVGQGEENAPEGTPAPPVEEVEPEPVEDTPPPAKEEPKKEKPTPDPKKDVKQTEDPEAARLKKEKEKQRQEELAKEKEKQKIEQAKRDKEAKEKAERDKAAAEKARKEKELKDAIGGALGGGNGDGKGNTGKPGNQGNPNGDPNAGALEGLGGSGNIGGDLGGRGVAFSPGNFQHNCPQTGKMVIWVCADPSGVVTKVEFRQQGSDINGSCNKSAAIAHAKKYRFSKSDRSDCGPITYHFTVK